MEFSYVKTRQNGFLAIAISVVMMMAACTKTNQPMVKQVYHDLTAHYNSFFNANENLNIVLNSLEKTLKEDYSQIINLYPYGSAEDAGAYSGDFETIIEKASKSIEKHEISRWADNDYLLIGKSEYLQGNYQEAFEAFQYITSEYGDGYMEGVRPEATSKKKKKKSKSKSSSKDKKPGKDPEYNGTGGVFEHDLSKFEALVWIVKCYVQLEAYKEAESILAYAKAKEGFPEDLRRDLDLAEAFIHLKQDKYALAIPPINAYLLKTKKKKEKARYHFIKGQLFEEMSNYPSALASYQEVLESAPKYEMDFNANLKIAKLARKGGMPLESSKKLLTKMSKDSKNDEYLDQIYFELAEIAMVESQFEEAKKYFQLCLRSAVGESQHKALAYLRLGQIFFEEEAYADASLYYDSTIQILPQDYDGYAEIDRRRIVLADLVEQLNIIASEDSLQKLAELPEDERKALIEELIERKKQKEEQDKIKKEAAKNQPNAGKLSLNQKVTNPAGGTSKWYFYNTSARSKGYNDFLKQWGDRKLKDHWRRNDKSSLEELEASDEEIEVDSLSAAADTLSDEEKMKGNIPIGDEALSASNDKIVEAYYNLGMIYRDDLDNVRKAITTFEELLNRFPKSKLELETLYNLYLSHKAIGESAKANSYRSRILNEYADSKIAKLIQDPSYKEELEQTKEELELYYETTYDALTDNQYDQVIERAERASNQYPSNHLQPKFDFLAALAQRGKSDESQFVASLSKIISDYPNHEVKGQAEQLLDHLKGIDREGLQKQIEEWEKNPVRPKPGTIAGESSEAKGDIIIDGKVFSSVETKIVNEDGEEDLFGGTGDSATANGSAGGKSVDLNSIYSFEDSVEYIVFFKFALNARTTTTSGRLKSYNSKNHRSLGLKVRNQVLNLETKMLIIEAFPDAEQSLDYMNAINGHKVLFKGFKPEDYQAFIISKPNFDILIGEEKLDEYIPYFEYVYGQK